MRSEHISDRPSLPTPLVDVTTASEPPSGVLRAVLLSKAPASPDTGSDSSGSDSSGWESPRLGPGADVLGVDDAWVEANQVKSAAGCVQTVPTAAGPGWLIGVGAGENADWRAAGAALTRAAGSGTKDVDGSDEDSRTVAVVLPDDTTADQAAAFAIGAAAASHRYRVTAKEQPSTVSAVVLVGADPDAVRRATVLAEATALARDFAQTPSDTKTPDWLTRTAAEIAGTVPGLTATVHDEQWLAAEGFGGVLAVGAGSTRPPRLLELSWVPDRTETDQHLVLVGKGVTFDTGGISIKPAEGMHLMRTDMAGGAAVIGAMMAIARLRLPVRVSALVPSAENHVSGSAYRPGDIVRHRGGRTAEITNTDAEGRLLLADALAYATETLAPDLLVDVATLTGAMKVSLGVRTGGLFASDDAVAERLLAAADAAGERLWRMPLLADLAAEVESEVADLRQCPPGPGGITAALFLREFTGGVPWAHLDIAGPARAEGAYDEINPGATGFATRTLVELAAAFVG